MTIHITAQLKARVQPLDRGTYFEDPLDEALREHRLGETSGGGTMMEKSGEIKFIDVEIEAIDDSTATLSFIKDKLEDLGTPMGSKLLLADPPREIPIGNHEGMAVYLNGTDLPEQVYATCDVNVVWETFERLLAGSGSLRGHWRGPTETALYAYGPSFEVTQTKIAEFVAEYPLCQAARIVKIA